MKKIVFYLLVAFVSIQAQAQKAKSKKNKQAKTQTADVAPLVKGASLFVASDVVDYGKVAVGSDRVRKFTVFNKGSEPLVIQGCSGSCGCTVPTCPKEPIMPGESSVIEINYDTNRPGPISKIVTILSNDATTPSKIISIKGEVQ
ncbi:MAG: DUF1573 domain-containing protein [Chitinophagales bacterium]|jgi:hypothetical protein|nr:DUF1573 domain-containing protein [Chitinophagales bacterium]